MARYEAGETLASIARTYDCSPPAISYIVSRSRDRQPAAETAAAVAEPQLIKAHAEADVAPPPASIESPVPAAPVFGDRSGLTATLTRPVSARPNGAAPQPAPQANGDRRTLHLSLGGNGSNGNGNGSGSGSGVDHGGNGFRGPGPQAQPQPQPPYQPYAQNGGERVEPRQPPMPPREQQPRYNYQANGGTDRGFNDAPPDAGRKKDPGTYIDQELRARVDGDIAAFLAAFDAALAGDNQEIRTGLREATDRLLRAGARTRIELERLEARVPLSSPRDGDGRAEPNWRHR